MRRVCLLLLFLPSAAHAQWQLQDAHTTADLRGIDNVGNGVAWASGNHGTVLRTLDNGATWQRCAMPPGAEALDFRGIQAFDEDTAIVMSSGKGDLSRLYKTIDGCQAWTLVLTNPDHEGFWDGVVFNRREPYLPSPDWRSQARGFLVGDAVNGHFVLYTTIDSGTHWQRWANDRHERPARAEKDESLFAASNSSALATGVDENLVFATGGRGGSHFYLLDRHDPFDAQRGLAFTRTRLPISASESAGAFSIAFRATKHPAYTDVDFMVVGGDYRKADTQGGAVYLPARDYSWFGIFGQKVQCSERPPHGYRSAVAYHQPTNTWITVGPNGTDISTDDGKNWRALKPGPGDDPEADQHWNALSLPFVVGPHGRIGILKQGTLTHAEK